jgi:hypothetical protein
MSDEYLGTYKVVISRIRHLEYGDCLEKVWTKGSEKHRLDGPAVELYSIELNPNESLEDIGADTPLIREWYQNGERHRLDGPAYVFDNGSSTEQRWYQNNQLHRTDGPAMLDELFSEPVKQIWYHDGLEHREDGPSTIWKDVTSKIIVIEEWKQRGNYHRLDGPALIERDSDTGETLEAEHFENGVPVDKSGVIYDHTP